jgi:predicted amidohydrolase YtcJ
VWSAINRRTRSDVTLGAQERIDLISALRAITIDAAWQSYIDDDLGSIEAGKLADLIVLSADPAAVDDVRTLSVDLTYIGGDLVYQRE